MLEQKIDQPIIKTARLQLRPLRGSDTHVLEQVTSQFEVAKMTTNIPHPLPDGAVATWLARAAEPGRTEDIWAMDGSDAGLPAIVGMIKLERMDRQQSEIAYWVVPGYWNEGIASEAVEGMVRANPHGARTLFGAVFQDNPASARVLTHAGFAYLGDAEAFSSARDRTVPTWTYLRKLEA